MFRFFFTIWAAFKPLIGGIILKEQTSLYTYPGRYANEHGELEQYRASYRANIFCKEAIEHSITAHYGNNRLDPACVKPVVEQFGYERVFYVLANTVRQKDFDGRISHDNKAWAKTIPVCEDPDGFGGDRNVYFVVDRPHTGLTDLFLTQVRKRMIWSRKRSLPCVTHLARLPYSRHRPRQKLIKVRNGNGLKI